MTSTDAIFSGAIPALYDRYMVPLLFAPYAADLVQRAAALQPRRILETAAGTGVVTDRIILVLPEAEVMATDLNQAMLDVAAARIGSPMVRFRQADAQALPFADASFDLVICQFGAMFFPDRIAAYREARRVLEPGGRLLFNIWDRIEANPLSQAIGVAIATLFPDAPPNFFERVPFGYHDVARIERDLRAAGFADIVTETVGLRSDSRSGSARDAATGLVHGTPLGAEIERNHPGRLDALTEAVTAAIDRLGEGGAVDAPMSAHVVSARA